MIAFYVGSTRLPEGHRQGEALIERTSKWWRCSDKLLEEYGDYALAVGADKMIKDVYHIRSWKRDEDNGLQVLDLEELPADHRLKAWQHHVAPVARKRGDRNEFKYISVRGAAFVPEQLVSEHGTTNN